MPTAKQIAKQRLEIRRQLERDARRKDQARLRTLRTHLRHARKLGGQRTREIVTACKQARARLRARRRELRARYAAELAAAQEALRLASRSRCEAAKDQARAKGLDAVRRAAAALEAERAHQAHARVWARKSPLGRPAPRARRAEAIHESDSEVANNLPEDLLPVWRAIKGQIRGTDRRSRTEAFLEWVQEHRGVVRNILDEQIDRDVAELVAHEAELRARVASPRNYRRMSDAQLRDDVPF